MDGTVDIKWKPIKRRPPKDRDILVWYDHDKDLYIKNEETGELTPYATWAESGEYMGGKGICTAKWFEQHWESIDEYGAGYWLPAYWFAKQMDDYECVVNPTHWAEIEEPVD